MLYESIRQSSAVRIDQMRFLCNLGFHKPDLTTILRKDRRLEAFCDACSCPIEKIDNGRWAAVAPLVDRPADSG